MRLHEWIFGYRELSVPSEERSAVFSALHEASVTVRRQRESGGELSFLIDAADCRKMTAHFRDAGIQYHLGRVRGLPRFFLFCRKRWGLLLGAALVLFLFAFSRSRVWEIRISGAGTIDEDRIRETLAELGMYEGMPLGKLDADMIAAEYLLADPRVAYMHIHTDGVVAEVEWIPSKSEEEPIVHPEGTYANLVASCDAVIEDIRLSRGEAAVKVGEVVHTGDLLVSGVRDGRLEYAEGEILGRVKRTVKVTVPLEKTVTVTKDKKTEAVTLILFGKRIRLKSGEGKTVTEVSPLWIGNNIRLPIAFERSYSFAVEEKTEKLSESEAVTVAMRRLSAEINAYLAEGELMSKKVEGGFENGCYTVTAEIEYLINIAKTLEFSASKD